MTAVTRGGGPELRALLDWAKELGFTCDITGGTHLVFRRPHTRPVYASYTPSCPFARKRTKGDLRRALRDAEQQQTDSKE
jgi:hypothetical protein